MVILWWCLGVFVVLTALASLLGKVLSRPRSFEELYREAGEDTDFDEPYHDVRRRSGGGHEEEAERRIPGRSGCDDDHRMRRVPDGSGDHHAGA